MPLTFEVEDWHRRRRQDRHHGREEQEWSTGRVLLRTQYPAQALQIVGQYRGVHVRRKHIRKVGTVSIG